MTSMCRTSFAHAYDPEKSIPANFFDVEYDEVLWPEFFSQTCYSGFIPSTDLSTLFVIVGVIVGQYYWSKRPRISGAVMAGTIVFWACYQFIAFRLSVAYYYSEMGYEAAEILFGRAHSAFWQQALFEITCFLAASFAIAYLLGNWRRRLPGNDEIFAKPDQ